MLRLQMYFIVAVNGDEIASLGQYNERLVDMIRSGLLITKIL
jgi:hypothetical protein